MLSGHVLYYVLKFKFASKYCMGKALRAFWLGQDTWREPVSCAGVWEQLHRAVGSLHDQTVPVNGGIK